LKIRARGQHIIGEVYNGLTVGTGSIVAGVTTVNRCIVTRP
jgi:hypothetical protein